MGAGSERSQAGEAIGDELGPYRLLERIGEGGFGSVWLAEQQRPVQRKVALKVVKLGMDTAQLVARFESERQVLAHLEHPGIAKVYDAGASESGRPYFVMEYVEGASITGFADEQSLSTEARLRLFVTVCNAVQHAHQKGVIHRDIKPSNVIVGLVDGAPLAKVIDFGIAKVTAPELADRAQLTEHLQVLGTPEYMAPEQADPTRGDIDTRADVYSLGVLLYELLTSTRPFDLQTVMQFGYQALLKHIREAEPPRPSTRVSSLGEVIERVASERRTTPAGLRRMVRGDLDWIVLKALEKDRERRYATVAELADDIERHLANEPVLASPPSALYRLRKFSRRHRVLVTTSAAILLGLVIATGGLGWSLLRVRDERDEADLARTKEVEARGDAQRAFVEADGARRRAENSLEQADEVVAFLVDMLRAVDPHRDGRDVTVREVLERAGERVEQDFPDQPLVRLALHLAISRSYRGLGIYEPAEEHAALGLELARAQLGPDDPQLVQALQCLGSTRFSRGDYARAGALLEEAFAKSEEFSGADDAATGVALTDLGYLRLTEGRWADAEELLLRGRAILMAARGEDDDETLALLANLQHLYFKQGRLEESRALLERVLELRVRRLGPDALTTLTQRSNRAVALSTENRLEEAEVELRAVLALRREALGIEHRDTATSLVALANHLRKVGEREEAAELLEQAVESLRISLGNDHHETANALRWLGIVQWRLGRLGDAEESLSEAVLVCEEQLGIKHSDTLEARGVLAIVLFSQGYFDDARLLWEDNRVLLLETIGEEHALTHQTRGNLGMVYQQLGRYAEAEEHYLESLAFFRARLGDGDALTRDSISNLATLYNSMGRLEEAAALHREALELRTRALGSDNPTTMGSQQNLAGVYRKQGRLEDAASLSLMTLAGQRAKLGATHPDTLLTATTLASVRYLQGRLEEAEAGFREVLAQHPDRSLPVALFTIHHLALVLAAAERVDEAEALVREALDGRRRALGDEHPDTLDSLRELAVLMTRAERVEDARACYEELIAAQLSAARRPDAQPQQLEITAVVLLEAWPAELRDPRQALELVRRADELTGHHQASVLRTLALALEATGDAPGAAQAARRALELYSPSATDRARLEELLETSEPDDPPSDD